MILDGEVAALDQEGKTDFQALQNYTNGKRDVNLTYVVFDLLALDGEDLRGYPLTERKRTLEKLMKNPPEGLLYGHHIEGSGKEFFYSACNLDLEGVVGKRARSVYSGERNGDWIKVKCGKRQEFVVGGYTVSDKKARDISSLLLGYYSGGRLIYAGRAGTGIGEAEAKNLFNQFKNTVKESPSFENPPKKRYNETMVWVKPSVVAEIKFAEWTDENLLRQASYKGVRTDKNPLEVVMEKAGETAGGKAKQSKNERAAGPSIDGKSAPRSKINQNSVTVQGIEISNPDKVLFHDPEVKKIDIARYYQSAAKRMIKYAGGRILSIVRCPKGVTGECFFKKHPAAEGSAGLVVAEVVNSGGKKENYFYIDSEAGFVSEAQMGTIEFHVWGSRAENLEKPDMMVFDLDPDEGMDLEKVRRGVKDLKSVLDDLSLTSFLKTSGGKGYHVVVPFAPSASWQAFRDFSRSVAEIMAQKWPDRYTTNIRKVNRKGKIFIDWVRNGRGATSVAPYSVRARKGAKVSLPISWSELSKIAPDGADMSFALNRLSRPDPWKNFFNCNQTVE